MRQQLLVLDDCEHVLSTRSRRWSRRSRWAPPGWTCWPPAGRRCGWTASRCCRWPRWTGAAAADAAGRPDPRRRPRRSRPRADPAVLERICARLDRLPLALELAAARVPAIGLAGLLGALDDPLDALGRRPAHRRVRGTGRCATSSSGPTGCSTTGQRELFVRLGGVRRTGRAGGGRGGVRAGAGRCPTWSTARWWCAQRRRPGHLRDAGDAARVRPDPAGHRSGGRRAARPARRLGGRAGRATPAPLGHGRTRPPRSRRFDAHLADVGRAHAWLCAHGPLEDLLRLGLVCAELSYQRARVDLARLRGARR